MFILDYFPHVLPSLELRVCRSELSRCISPSGWYSCFKINTVYRLDNATRFFQTQAPGLTFKSSSTELAILKTVFFISKKKKEFHEEAKDL